MKKNFFYFFFLLGFIFTNGLMSTETTNDLASTLINSSNKDLKTTQNSQTLKALIERMIDYHPNIKMYQQIIQGAQANLEGAKWNYFPTPSIGTNYTTKNIDSTSLMVEQPLWTGGKLDAAYDIASANKEVSKFALKENSYLLVEALLTALQTYLTATEDIVALHNGLSRLHRLEEMIVRREDSGVSSKADIDLLRARIYQVEASMNNAKTKKEISLAQLELLVGQKIDENMLLFDQFTPLTFESSKAVVTSMLEYHPVFSKYEAQIAQAKAELDKAKAILMPTVSVKAQKFLGSSSLYDNEKDNDTVVYLSIQATPGAGLSSLSARQAAEAKILQLIQEKDSRKQDLINQVVTYYNNYTFATSRISLQENLVQTSQNVFESYIRLFLTGKRQWLDLVTASRELTDNELAYIDTKVTRLMASYQLALLNGSFNSYLRLNHDDL